MSPHERKRNQLRESLAISQLVTAGALLVSEVMTRDPACVTTTCTALELVELLHDRQFRHVLVTEENGDIAGIVSDRDVLRCFGLEGPPTKEYLRGITTGQLMTDDLVTVEPTARVLDSLRLMLAHGISSLPVVFEGKPLGILTSTDIYLILETLLESAQPERRSLLATTEAGGPNA